MLKISLKPETLATIGTFPVSNSFLASIVVSLLLIILFVVVNRKLKDVPGKTQLFLEFIVVGLYNFVRNTVPENTKLVAWFSPLFITLVLFFLFSNLLGLIPFLGAISYSDQPLYRAPTSDYGMVLVVTVVMFVLMQIVAVVSGGILPYIKKYLNFSSPLNFLLGLLDIIGELAKVVSLSFRLFGNVFAGEVLAAVIFSLVPYIAPIPFSLLGILSSVVQAFVFPILLLIFIAMNTASEAGMNKESKATS